MGRFLRVVLTLMFLLFLASQAFSQTVLKRVKLRNVTEGATFVSTGPFAHHIAILDGYDVLGFPAEGRGHAPAHKLFDLRSLPIVGHPNGIAYIPQEKAFVISEGLNADKLVFCDHKGVLLSTLTIQYLNGYLPNSVEEIDYIPPDSPVYPDHFLLATADGIDPSHVQVIARNGQVDKEIVWPRAEDFLLGISFKPPDRVLGSVETWAEDGTVSYNIVEIDFSGNITRGPVPADNMYEALVSLPDGKVVAATNGDGKLLFFDADLQRQPALDRDYRIGLGLSFMAVGWDTDRNRFLVMDGYGVYSLPPSLDRATRVVDLTPYDPYLAANFRGLTYLPDEHRIATFKRVTPMGILLFDDTGSFTEQIPEDFRIAGLTYIPPTREFAMRTTTRPVTTLAIFDRGGTFVRSFDLAAAGLSAIQSVAFFAPEHPSGREFLVAGRFGNYLALITDSNGNVLRSFNYRSKLNVLDLTDVDAITTGPFAGAFVFGDSSGAELVVVRLGER